jgi:hypothetical protein
MALVISEIKLYELLKARIGEKEAEAFVQILENKVDSRLEEKTNVFATKEDIAKLEGKLTTSIAESKVDMIKWIVGTAIASCGLLLAAMKFFHL